MTKKKRSILLFVLTFLICISIIAAGSYALFTDEVTLDNHLQAGNLDVTLYRTCLVKKTLDETGHLIEREPDWTIVDYSRPNKQNALGLDGEKVVPGSVFTATFEIQNLSDVAFGYWIEIVCRDKSKGEDLAKQLKITVNTDSAFVGDGLIVKAPNSAYLKTIDVGRKDKFIVTVEFLDSFITPDLAPNDLAQGQSLDFDIVVKAVQNS